MVNTLVLHSQSTGFESSRRRNFLSEREPLENLRTSRGLLNFKRPSEFLETLRSTRDPKDLKRPYGPLKALWSSRDPWGF